MWSDVPSPAVFGKAKIPMLPPAMVWGIPTAMLASDEWGDKAMWETMPSPGPQSPVMPPFMLAPGKAMKMHLLEPLTHSPGPIPLPILRMAWMKGAPVLACAVACIPATLGPEVVRVDMKGTRYMSSKSGSTYTPPNMSTPLPVTSTPPNPPTT